MDASCCRSLVQPKPPENESRFYSKEPNQRTSIFGIRFSVLLLFAAVLSINVPLEQTARAQTLQPPANDYAVSVAELKVPDKAWSHLRAANKAFTHGDLKEAAREADQALYVCPECGLAFSMKALIEMAAKNSPAAVRDAIHATLVDPYNADAFIALAMAYNGAGDYSSATQAARQALAKRPESWQGRLELAKSLYGEGNFEAALAELGSVHTDFPDVHLVRGNVLMRLGRTLEGTDEFKVFLAEAPNDGRVQIIRQIVALTQPSSPF